MKKKILALFCVLTMLVGCSAGGNNTEGTGGNNTQDAAGSNTDNSTETIETITSAQLMKELKIGFNWGNTFDAPWGETTWGNPFTTKEMIEGIKELGFNTIRIPVSWGKHTSGAPDYIIDEEWMERVQTVVDYALDCGIRIHGR